MGCAWNAYITLLPPWLRPWVDNVGKDKLEELRLRLGYPPQMVLHCGCVTGSKVIDREDISYCINAASKYSPWSASTIAQGYITAAGGHRIGICGDAVIQDGNVKGISVPRYLCLRVARDFPGVAQNASTNVGSVLIIGPPGSGKTTFLRDMVRNISSAGTGSVAVVDERRELFPVTESGVCFYPGQNTDILSGCLKPQGIDMVLRTMGPSAIAVDEITAEQDCKALIQAGWCGVQILATAHAKDKEDLYSRPLYRPLLESGLFEHLFILRRDKTWSRERMSACTTKY